jgi:hypothetical protein
MVELLPPSFASLRHAVVGAIRRSYEANAARFDESVGDDAVVFGIAVYRNSWYAIEREVASLDEWAASRPRGSLVIEGSGHRIHVYRFGQDADVDLQSFRLDDEQASITQRRIAAANAEQLRLDLGDFDGLGPDKTADPVGELRELVIIHAGNPVDGCCAVWVGAPVDTDEVTDSPWAWVEPLWMLRQPISEVATASHASEMPRHDELPEPEVVLRRLDSDQEGLA